MIRSFNLRIRCATASTRGSAAAAAAACRAAPPAPALREEALRLARAEPDPVLRLLFFAAPLLLLRVVRFAPVERVPVERLRADEALELDPEALELDPDPEPLLLACGMLPPLKNRIRETLVVARAAL
jgi:hypothetical protein